VSGAGYARRNRVLGDIRYLDSRRVSGITHSGRPFSWKVGPDVELLEFGSFNPANANYTPGGRLVREHRAGGNAE
jgi:hypothetical protein